MNMHKSERVAEQAQQFYAELKAAGVDVLFDDRKERPGVMFADMELLGIPHAIVIGDRGLDNGVVEYNQQYGEYVIFRCSVAPLAARRTHPVITL